MTEFLDLTIDGFARASVRLETSAVFRERSGTEIRTARFQAVGRFGECGDITCLQRLLEPLDHSRGILQINAYHLGQVVEIRRPLVAHDLHDLEQDAEVVLLLLGDDPDLNRVVVLYGSGRARTDRLAPGNRAVSCS